MACQSLPRRGMSSGRTLAQLHRSTLLRSDLGKWGFRLSAVSHVLPVPQGNYPRGGTGSVPCLRYYLGAMPRARNGREVDRQRSRVPVLSIFCLCQRRVQRFSPCYELSLALWRGLVRISGVHPLNGP